MFLCYSPMVRFFVLTLYKKRWQGESIVIGRKTWILVVLFCLLALSACAGQVGQEMVPSSLFANNLTLSKKPTALAGPLNLAKQQPVVSGNGTKHATAPVSPTTSASPPTVVNPNIPRPITIPTTGPGVSPYGTPPAMSAEEIQLTQKLFALINSDRAARGLYQYTWNPILSGGARLHSWNMYHCGFSHTCPDGRPQCDRIAAEGFAGYTDCGENIAYAGPFPTAWQGAYKSQICVKRIPYPCWSSKYE